VLIGIMIGDAISKRSSQRPMDTGTPIQAVVTGSRLWWRWRTMVSTGDRVKAESGISRICDYSVNIYGVPALICGIQTTAQLCRLLSA
jgi:hypothetical protein